MASASKRVFTVQVRELVQFSLRRGDLGGGGEFVGRDRALAGIRGHQKLQRSRPEGYQKEIPVSLDLEEEQFVLRVQGRIDGLLSDDGELLLEEIKTVRGAWDGVAEPLHWAQAKCYAYIYARERSVPRITARLSYLNLDSGETAEFEEQFGFEELSEFFEHAASIYLQWLREREDWCRIRDESICALAFPFLAYRPGQRELAVAAYRTLSRGARCFVEAPTGIGKTISVLFPAFKALGEGKFERVYYLTARTSGRAVAEKALADARRAGLRLRAVTLTAKEKVCVQEGHPCDPQTCPLARGYYERNKAAMREALQREEITRPVLEEVARRHQICPFELSLDVSVWVDALVCDYNYVFDPKVYLRRHFENPGEYAFLVDEAHNLVDRGREMFSSELSTRAIQEARRAIKTALPRCARRLSRVTTVMRDLCAAPGQGDATMEEVADENLGPDLFSAASGAVVKRNAAVVAPRSARALANGRAVHTRKAPPEELAQPLDEALKETEAWLAKNEPAEFRETLLQLYFELLSFRRTLELYDERYVTIAEGTGKSVRVRLFCLDPSHLLRQALERGKAAVFFSATLSPLDYFRELLGGSPEDLMLQLPSPFPSEHLAVLMQDRIRTHYKARTDTLPEVAEAIGVAVGGHGGNYLVYFPSYQYLEAVRENFSRQYPAVRVLAQRPGMSEPEREQFLAEFSEEHSGTLVGFAVMGGVFGEGIDLVGERLIGAIIVGVGLPQLCVERDLIRDYFQQKRGSGFEFAYTFPGMSRVLQATGRVIRTELDRGVVLLIDARFGETRYQRLLPRHWRTRRVRNGEALRRAVLDFWKSF